jgi:antibiotic biosynthesis monooxygenase (ABM) superfamily enzyme
VATKTVVLEQLLPGLPLPARVVLTAVVNVSILTWLVMPALTKRCRHGCLDDRALVVSGR